MGLLGCLLGPSKAKIGRRVKNSERAECNRCASAEVTVAALSLSNQDEEMPISSAITDRPANNHLVQGEQQQLRDTMALATLPAMVSVLSHDGTMLHQNLQSKLYYGDRTGAADRNPEDVLELLFYYDAAKKERLLDELRLNGKAALWKGIVLVPPTLIPSLLEDPAAEPHPGAPQPQQPTTVEDAVQMPYVPLDVLSSQAGSQDQAASWARSPSKDLAVSECTAAASYNIVPEEAAASTASTAQNSASRRSVVTGMLARMLKLPSKRAPGARSFQAVSSSGPGVLPVGKRAGSVDCMGPRPLSYTRATSSGVGNRAMSSYKKIPSSDMAAGAAAACASPTGASLPVRIIPMPSVDPSCRGLARPMGHTVTGVTHDHINTTATIGAARETTSRTSFAQECYCGPGRPSVLMSSLPEQMVGQYTVSGAYNKDVAAAGGGAQRPPSGMLETLATSTLATFLSALPRSPATASPLPASRPAPVVPSQRPYSTMSRNSITLPPLSPAGADDMLADGVGSDTAAASSAATMPAAPGRERPRPRRIASCYATEHYSMHSLMEDGSPAVSNGGAGGGGGGQPLSVASTVSFIGPQPPRAVAFALSLVTSPIAAAALLQAQPQPQPRSQSHTQFHSQWQQQFQSQQSMSSHAANTSGSTPCGALVRTTSAAGRRFPRAAPFQTLSHRTLNVRGLSPSSGRPSEDHLATPKILDAAGSTVAPGGLVCAEGLSPILRPAVSGDLVEASPFVALPSRLGGSATGAQCSGSIWLAGAFANLSRTADEVCPSGDEDTAQAAATTGLAGMPELQEVEDQQGEEEEEEAGVQLQHAALLPGPRIEPECWHEVWATAGEDPVTGQDVIILHQGDITQKVIAERHLALVMETEHRLVEQLFPRHILQYIMEEWTAREGMDEGTGQQPRPGMRRPSNMAGRMQEVAAETEALLARASTLRDLDLIIMAKEKDTEKEKERDRDRDRAAQLAGGSWRWRPVIRDCNALATWHPEVTLLFADIRGFTPMCNEVEPRQVMGLLNALYSRYDAMLDKYGVYKVETIGDCYFVAGGLIHEDEDGMAAVRERSSQQDPLHAERVFHFAKAMLRAAREVLVPTTGQPVEIRIGLHTGPVVSGVVGTRMPRFCLFGDTVNTASRMESTGVPGAIHASEATYLRLQSGQQAGGTAAAAAGWEPTGGIQVKGKGLMQTNVWRPEEEGA